MKSVSDALLAQGATIGAVYRTRETSFTQREVDTFGALTENLDPMHNDPQWAEQHQAFGPTTIVHGLFVASLIPRWLKEVPNGLHYTTDRSHTLNYGIDRLRWIKPIPVGAHFHATIELVDFEERGHGRFKFSYHFEVMVAGDSDPSMVATSHLMIVSNE